MSSSDDDLYRGDEPPATPPPSGPPPGSGPAAYPAPDQPAPGYGMPGHPVGPAPAGYPPPAYGPPAYAPAGYAPAGYGQPGYPLPGYGAPGYPPGYGRPTNTMAILALVMAFVFPPAGLVCGIVARKQIRRTGEDGEGLALAGIIVGGIATAVLVLVFVFLVAAFTAATSYGY